jgi:MFS family permease
MNGGPVRPWIIWATGILAYVVAVLNRTTLGVSGLEAGDRFHASPSVLSTFVVLQIIVYAGAQVPAGVLLDRFGSKILIVSGAALMVTGQLAIALTDSLPLALTARAVVGLGDAVTFISVLRLVPHWFPARQVPLLTQLTGISGQLGQVLSAVPFLALLGAGGWTSAYLSVAAFGVLTMVLAAALLQNTPDGRTATTKTMTARDTMASVRTAWMRPGTRLGFFTHMGTQFSVTAFSLMWGVPYITTAQGQTRAVAGMLLTISVVTAISAGVVLGILTGRYPHRRSWFVLAIIGSNAAIWTVVLALPGRAPLWLLIVLVVIISVGGPGSMVGFDFARTFNPSAILGTAQGMVNMGGFLASLLLMQAMGWILDAAGGYSTDSFRLAWTVQYVVWAVAVTGILITRRKARRLLNVEGDRSQLETFDIQPTKS